MLKLHKFTYVLGGVILIVITLWALNLIIAPEDFGPVNALFSGLAFAGVIWAILLQKNELVLQREELKLTRETLEGQKEQLSEQSKTLKRQNFESTFFSLLNLHNNMVNALKIFKPIIGSQIQGRDCFSHFYDLLQDFHNKTIAGGKAPNDPMVLEIAYDRLHNEIQTQVGHYFRNLYNIVRFVDDSDVEDKWLYIRLVRAQLSVFELTLLFYNCLSTYGKGFKPLVEKYTLLKTIDDKNIINPAHRSFYKPSAFESGGRAKESDIASFES